MRKNLPGSDEVRATLHRLLDELFDRACDDFTYAMVGGAVLTDKCGDPECTANHPRPTLVLSFHKEVSEGLMQMASSHPESSVEYHKMPSPNEYH